MGATIFGECIKNDLFKGLTTHVADMAWIGRGIKKFVKNLFFMEKNHFVAPDCPVIFYQNTITFGATRVG